MSGAGPLGCKAQDAVLHHMVFYQQDDEVGGLVSGQLGCAAGKPAAQINSAESVSCTCV